jgi:poly(3-hydroxyalkanoate) synthetase
VTSRPHLDRQPIHIRTSEWDHRSEWSLVDGLAEGGANPRRAEKARFAIGIVTSALAPTNFLPTNPAALKHAFETGGRSLLRGARNFVDDVAHNGGMPSMVERDAFVVGRDLAVTPGAVVARDPVGELIQYRSSTERVHQRPVLVVPPPIGRYYFLDLRPGRSFVEYAVASEMQTFLLSWRNPTAEQGEWDLDTYAARVSTAIDAVREITGSPDVNLIGFCAGGIIATTLLNHLAATGDERVHSTVRSGMPARANWAAIIPPCPCVQLEGRGDLRGDVGGQFVARTGSVLVGAYDCGVDPDRPVAALVQVGVAA